MAFAKFDDGYADHPSIRGLSDAAFRLHTAGILHCAKWLTDGVIKAEDVPDLVRRYRPSALAELVEKGRWMPMLDGTYYEVCGYLDWNDSRDKVEKRRRTNAERLRRWREANGSGDES